MKLQLIGKESNGQDITSFIFKPEETLIFKPGQFLRYQIENPAPDERGKNRFFSISSAPFEGVIKLTTKISESNGSTFKKDLKKMGIGEFIEAFGPSGSFTIDEAKKNYVFIAGGIGITPFRSILLDLDQQGKPLNITLLYANKTNEIPFKEELETLAKKHPEFKIYYVLSISEDVIRSSLLPLSSPLFYISGPEPMVLNVMDMLVKIGIPKENIKRDEFPGYEGY